MDVTFGVCLEVFQQIGSITGRPGQVVVEGAVVEQEAQVVVLVIELVGHPGDVGKGGIDALQYGIVVRLCKVVADADEIVADVVQLARQLGNIVLHEVIDLTGSGVQVGCDLLGVVQGCSQGRVSQQFVFTVPSISVTSSA